MSDQFNFLCRYPEDSQTYDIDTQFMWGDGLLISPVLKQVKPTCWDLYIWWIGIQNPVESKINFYQIWSAHSVHFIYILYTGSNFLRNFTIWAHIYIYIYNVYIYIHTHIYINIYIYIYIYILYIYLYI